MTDSKSLRVVCIVAFYCFFDMNIFPISYVIKSKHKAVSRLQVLMVSVNHQLDKNLGSSKRRLLGILVEDDLDLH